MVSERRLHPLSFLFAIQESAKQFLLPALFALFATRNRDMWEVWGAVFVVPLAVVALGRALSFRYRFEPTELVIRSGFIFRRVRHIPYDRVQNVDARQNVLHRLLGVIEVRVETGGGTEPEAVMRVVSSDALEEIRARVFAERAVGAVLQPARTGASAHVLLAMSALEVFLFGLINGRGMIVLGAMFGLLWEFGLMDGANQALFGTGSAGRGVFRQIFLAIFDEAPFPLLQVIVSVMGLVVLLGVLRLASALWTSLTYYGFTITRAGDDLRCQYGLLTRVTSTIPVRRIQKVTIREGPWHRLADRVSVGVQTAGGKAEEGGEGTRSWLAPLVRHSALDELLSGIVPEATADVPWQPVHPRAVRREFVGAMIIVTLASLGLAYGFGWWAMPAFVFLTGWAFYNAKRTVAALRWGMANETVQFASGWIYKNRLVAPLTKVQVVSRHQSPLDRRHGMASVFADTAGRAHEGYAIHIPYLSTPVASALAQQLSAAAARTAFRW